MFAHLYACQSETNTIRKRIADAFASASNKVYFPRRLYLRRFLRRGLRSYAWGGGDMLIKNGFIVDGTGSPWYRADVRVRGDRTPRSGAFRPRKVRPRSRRAG